MNDHIQNIIIRAKDRASRILGKIGNVARGVTKSIFSLKTAFIGLGSAMAIKSVVDKSMGAFMRLENAMLGLSSVATKVGLETRTALGYMTVDAESAKQAAKELSSDGLMSIDDAATGLKNLLLAGFGMPQAVDMINAFKDSAAFGRQGALSFGEAIRSATEGVKNGNSILVDNAGITKNLSNMQKEYAISVGTTIGKLTEAQKQEAIYQGVLKEARTMQGDAAKMTDTYQGAVSQLDNSVFHLWSTLGESLAPVLKDLIQNQLKPIVEQTAEWIKQNKELISSNVREGLQWMIEKLKGIKEWLVGDTDAAGALSAMVRRLGQAFRSVEDALNRVSTAAENTLDLIDRISNSTFGRVVTGDFSAIPESFGLEALNPTKPSSTAASPDYTFTAQDLYDYNARNAQPVINATIINSGQPAGALP